MSEYFFGLGWGKVSDRRASAIDKIAEAHGGYGLTRYREPSGAWRYWLSGPNRGQPFDDSLAAATIAALDDAGLWPPCPKDDDE